MLLASYRKQGLPAPTLGIAEDAEDIVSSSTASLSWKMKKWQRGLHLKQQRVCYPDSDQLSGVLPVLATTPMQPFREEWSNKEMEEDLSTSIPAKIHLPVEAVEPALLMDGCFDRYALCFKYILACLNIYLVLAVMLYFHALHFSRWSLKSLRFS